MPSKAIKFRFSVSSIGLRMIPTIKDYHSSFDHRIDALDHVSESFSFIPLAAVVVLLLFAIDRGSIPCYI